ncbi:MAG TPA: hypothetical protein VMG12_31475 [Polyangiaceae bacterium]|nr:hypothetical protein [Polyangiaceae bacterium]
MTSRIFGSLAVCCALLALRCSSDDSDDMDRGNVGGSAFTGTAGTSGAAAGEAAGAGGSGMTGGTAGVGMTGDDTPDAAVSAGGVSAGGMGASAMTPVDMADLSDVSFQEDVWPVLVAHCAGVGCHGAGSFLPEHANADVNVAFEEAAPVADRIAGRVSGQLMPIMPQNCGPAPGFGMCLSLDEVALIRAWVEQGAPF